MNSDLLYSSPAFQIGFFSTMVLLAQYASQGIFLILFTEHFYCCADVDWPRTSAYFQQHGNELGLLCSSFIWIDFIRENSGREGAGFDPRDRAACLRYVCTCADSKLNRIFFCIFPFHVYSSFTIQVFQEAVNAAACAGVMYWSKAASDVLWCNSINSVSHLFKRLISDLRTFLNAHLTNILSIHLVFVYFAVFFDFRVLRTLFPYTSRNTCGNSWTC